MTLRPHKALTAPDAQTIWDPPKPMTEHGERIVALRQGVDHMTARFKDATATKAEKRRMMDEMHETSLERVEMTRKDIDALLIEVGHHLEEFHQEYQEKVKVLFAELDVAEVERIEKINARFQKLEERQAALAEAIQEETDTRIREAEAILIPARRSVESLVVDLEKEREIRRSRDEELKQRLEEVVSMLADSIENETVCREERHVERIEEVAVDTARLKKRAELIEQTNREKEKVLREAIDLEEVHRKDGQDQVVVKITDFIHRFQAHIKEEGEMGC